MNTLKFVDVFIAKASWNATAHRILIFSFGHTTINILNVTFLYIFQILPSAIPISDVFSMLHSVNEPVVINVSLCCYYDNQTSVEGRMLV